MKIAYYGYDFFHACLKLLIDTGHEITHIYSFPCDGQFNHNSYIKTLASSVSITVNEQSLDQESLKELESQGVELLITAGYQYKIPDLGQTKIKGINIHPTLLPNGRGVWPLPWVILNKLTRNGVTIHKLNNDWDAGDIILQQEFSVSKNENLESLSVKTQLLAANMLGQFMNDMELLWQQAQPQNEMSATHWPMPGIQQRYIDWTISVEEIDRIIRAFGKFSALAKFDNALWDIFEATCWSESHSWTPGEKVHVTNTETIIAARDGLVCLRYFRHCQDQDIVES